MCWLEVVAVALHDLVRAGLGDPSADDVPEEHGSGQIMLRHKLSQGDLAAMAGVARENVSRTLAEWRKSNVVTKDCPYYCIKDPDALAREMEFET